MSTVQDPVCGMMLDADTAPARFSYDGTMYYFCSTMCRDNFVAEPERYLRTIPSSETSSPMVEQHEPRFTVSGGIPAPKFGSAGSGGAEYELLPEAHAETD